MVRKSLIAAPVWTVRYNDKPEDFPLYDYVGQQQNSALARFFWLYACQELRVHTHIK